MRPSPQSGPVPPQAPPPDAAGALRLQFLAWLEEWPRSYDETMAAWRSHCPRLSVWEDALAEGLVRIEYREHAAGGALVRATERGRALLGTE